MSDFLSVKNHLLSLADKKRAKNLARFFKTGPGEYGEGDMFLGITVPQQREVAKKFVALPLADVVKLLHSKEHECRLTALIILVGQYSRATTDAQKRKIFNLYLSNAKWINNWDLVDLSSYQIVGAYLADKNRSRLLKLAHSKNIWEKRIAIISTFAFIKNKKAEHISRFLLPYSNFQSI